MAYGEGTMIAGIITRHIHEGQELYTPGTGSPARGKSKFTIGMIEDTRITFVFERSAIQVSYRHIDYAVCQARRAGGTVRIGSRQGRADSGTLQRFLQDAQGNVLMNASYIAPVLVECGIAEYVMIGRSKGLRFT